MHESTVEERSVSYAHGRKQECTGPAGVGGTRLGNPKFFNFRYHVLLREPEHRQRCTHDAQVTNRIFR